MKQCPICFQSYDDSENFCQTDGTTLSVISTEQKSYTTGNAPTMVVPSFHTGQQTNSVPVKQTSPILYAALGAMGVLVLVLAGVLLYPQFTEKEKSESAKSEERGAKGGESKNDSAANSQQSFQPKTTPVTENLAVVPAAQPQQPYISPAGSWQGQWTNGKALYDQQLTLKDDGNGKVSGQIVHTLQRSTNPNKTGKIGLTAVEYVQGSYDPNTRIITMAGIRKDDPNNLIILDKYRLSLSSDNSTIAGATVGGKTRGQITLRR
jgi:hypothetical protein